jgi:hypothetical protein
MLRAVAILALVVTTTTSKPPSPTPTKEAQGQQNQARKVRREPGANQQTTNTAPPALAQSGAVVTAGNQGYRGSVKKGHSANNWWEIAGTIAGVVNTILLTLFSGALAVLAYRQWLAMDRQAKLMHRQAIVMRRQLGSMNTTGEDTHNLARAAKDAAAAAKQQTVWAEHSTQLLIAQAGTMLTQARAAILSAEAAQQSAKAVAGSLEVTRLLERPWVRIELSAHTHLACEDGELWVTPWLKLTNVGRSVATDVRYACKLLPLLFGSVDATHTRFNDTTYRLPQTLLPGEDSGQVAQVSLALDTVDQQFIRPEGDDKLLSVAVACTVTYKFPTSSEVHTTHAIYHVGRYEQKKARITVKLGEGEILPSDLITFLKEPTGSYAD